MGTREAVWAMGCQGCHRSLWGNEHSSRGDVWGFWEERTGRALTEAKTPS